MRGQRKSHTCNGAYVDWIAWSIDDCNYHLELLPTKVVHYRSMVLLFFIEFEEKTDFVSTRKKRLGTRFLRNSLVTFLSDSQSDATTTREGDVRHTALSNYENVSRSIENKVWRH